MPAKDGKITTINLKHPDQTKITLLANEQNMKCLEKWDASEVPSEELTKLRPRKVTPKRPPPRADCTLPIRNKATAKPIRILQLVEPEAWKHNPICATHC